MALQTRNSNINYVRLKDGKFFLGKNLEQAYDELSGTITKMFYKDEEFEGIPQRKLVVVLTDGDDNYQLSLNSESSNYSSVVSFLKNVNINQPIVLVPKMEVLTKEGKEVKRYSLLVSQNGIFAKSYFTKDNPNGLPKWEIAVVGKKKITDKSAALEFLEEFVQLNFISKLPNFEHLPKPVENPVNCEVDDSDLPF